MDGYVKNIVLFFSDLFSWAKSRILLLTHLSFRRLSLALFILVTVAITILLQKSIVNALTNSWIQTDWSGGVDTEINANNTNLTDWNKFYSETNIDTSTNGEIKLDRILSTPAP